jgi:hypothetical protein
MGIQIEFNPDLALRDYNKYINGERKIEECVPQIMEVGKIYNFLKNGQRNYFLNGELPLIITEGNGNLSRPVASIIILEVTHFKCDNIIFTKGKYLIKEIFDLNSNIINFEGFNKI